MLRRDLRGQIFYAEPRRSVPDSLIETPKHGHANPDGFSRRLLHIRHYHDPYPCAMCGKHTILAILKRQTIVRRFPQAGSRKLIHGRIGFTPSDFIPTRNRIEEVEHVDPCKPGSNLLSAR